MDELFCPGYKSKLIFPLCRPERTLRPFSCERTDFVCLIQLDPELSTSDYAPTGWRLNTSITTEKGSANETSKPDHLVEQVYAADNCKSQSEFVEKAIQFYAGYLNTKNASAFLPEVLSTILIGIMDDFAQRMGRMLYKLSVEQNLCNHILTADTDMDQRTYQLMRGRSVREVDSTNGRITFKEVLDFQKSV